MSTSRPLIGIALSLPQHVYCDRAKFCIGSSTGKAGVHPPGTELYQLLLQRDGSKISVCAPCYDTLVAQDTTKRVSTVASSKPSQSQHSHGMPPPPAPHGRRVKGDAEIHQLVAAAQRHEKVKVRAIGTVAGTSGSSSRGPQIRHSTGGYNSNHSNYEAAQQANRKRALGTSTAILVSITIRLVHLAKTKSFQTFETCLKTIPEVVPVNITAASLLELAFKWIEQPYRDALTNLGFSETFPLFIDDVELQNAAGIPYKMDLDIPVIRHHFFKSAKDGSSLVFNNKATVPIVRLMLSQNWVTRYRNWTIDMEEEAFLVAEQTSGASKRKVAGSTKPARKRAKKQSETVAEPSSMMESQPIPSTSAAAAAMKSVSINTSRSVQQIPSSSAAIPNDIDGEFLSSHASRSRHSASAPVVIPTDLARALSLAKKTSATDAHLFVQIRTFRVGLKMVLLLPLDELTKAMSSSRLDRFATESEYTLSINFDHKSIGGFKAAFFGHISESPFTTSRLEICAKQAHDGKGANRKILSSEAQLKHLPDEISAHQWGNALLEATYGMMRSWRATKMCDDPHWRSKLRSPQLRFTEVGLAVEQGGGQHPKVFMVEERITGDFVKYIHNGSARLSASAQNDPVALFLSFTQHAQYILSDGMIFVSDYQGGLDNDGNILLTDPQIISDPKLGEIFAGGNVASAFYNFKNDHRCNSFCIDYGLAPLHDFVPIRARST
ncbi:Alpha-type protein kinase domain-containing protein [Mycena indigotica]|uniref:Alpha-type protein kinase domain-containing protein n=1 Tax=Mycena indigotica TaxID=2126181 RepID=A0A8H6W8N3_9AGAR|nr:Alpha-type protein kinase domain-containing protein [Mycena indigotica]KAF7307111.1 Alpha-type protein kinase domain-containing protein [Mycena indigotica]